MKRIYARNCEVKEITNNEANDFFGMYHKQGALTTSTVAFGLFYNGELVQAESFGLPRIEMQAKSIWHDWELYRECSKEDYSVIGGKSKLLKAFENEYKPLALLSYCNTTLGFDGHSYAACGFKLERTSDDYYYEYNGDIIKRYKMQKNSNLRKQGKVEPIQRTLEFYGFKYDPNKTEKENAEAAGFKRLNGTGQQVWTKLYSKDVAYIYDFELNGKHYVGQHTLYKNGILTGRTDYIGSGTYWLNAVKKYGKKSVVKNIICWTTDLTTLAELEYECIMEAVNKYGKENMYNLDYRENTASNHKWENDERTKSSVSERKHLSMLGKNKGKKLSIEARDKLSQAHIGKVKSDEARRKLSESLKAYYRTDSGKEKARRVAELNTGKKRTTEQKQRMSDAMKGKPSWCTGMTLASGPLQQEIKTKGHRNNKPRPKETYTDEWKQKVSEQTKIKMAEQKAKDIEYIHSMGYITVEDLVALGWKDKQIGKLTPVGRYKKLKYFNKPE